MTIETVSKQMTAGKTATNNQTRPEQSRRVFAFWGLLDNLYRTPFQKQQRPQPI